MSSKIPEQLEKIGRDLAAVTTIAGELSSGHEKSIQAIRKQDRWRWGSVAVLGLVVIFVIGQIFELRRLAELAAENRQQITVNQDNIAAIQQRTSIEALCPLWDIFLASYRPNSPQALEDPAKYEASFQVIENGAAAMGCARTQRIKPVK